MIVKLDRLKIPKIHEEIYCTYNVEDLKQSIAETGLLEKIVINKNFEIVSGVRRFKALKELGHSQVEVIVKNTQLENETVLRIAYNKQREKTASEKLNEIERLRSIWAQTPGRKSASISSGSTSNGEKVDTRAKISKELNISAGNISKLQYINEKKPELIAEIDKGNITINQAHRALKKHELEIKTLNHVSLPVTISKENYTIFNKSSNDLSDIENETVQLIFTSPPYWKLRQYSNDPNELGNEKTSAQYVQNLLSHLNDCYRVLNPNGSFFLNLGDTYDNKCLQLIPQRVVFELMKKGWFVRNAIIWKKNNGIPQTSKDKLTTSYEHIFHLVKSKNYDYNEILLPINQINSKLVNSFIRKSHKQNLNDLGRVSISGLKGGKRMEDFWTDDIIYTACANQAAIKRYAGISHPAPFPPEICVLPILQTTKPRDTVLDIFSGTGSVGEVALLLGRKFIGYDLNPIYNKGQVNRFDEAIKQFNQGKIKVAA